MQLLYFLHQIISGHDAKIPYTLCWNPLFISLEYPKQHRALRDSNADTRHQWQSPGLICWSTYTVRNGTSSDFSQESFLSPSVAKDTGRKVCF